MSEDEVHLSATDVMITQQRLGGLIRRLVPYPTSSNSQHVVDRLAIHQILEDRVAAATWMVQQVLKITHEAASQYCAGLILLAANRELPPEWVSVHDNVVGSASGYATRELTRSGAYFHQQEDAASFIDNGESWRDVLGPALSRLVEESRASKL